MLRPTCNQPSLTFEMQMMSFPTDLKQSAFATTVCVASMRWCKMIVDKPSRIMKCNYKHPTLDISI